MNLSEKIMVTGANGLLGTNTIIHLLNQGYYVVGFLRNKEKYLGGSHKNLELVEGDLMNTDDLMKVSIGCKFIVHTAALTNQNIQNYSTYKRINVYGLRNVVEAAIHNNVKKIVHVSSANVYGYGDLNNLGDETKEMSYPFTESFYAKSKKESQEFILSKKINWTL